MADRPFDWKDGLALEKLLLARIEALEKTAEITNDAMGQAAELARHNMELRLESMNAIRSQLHDQAGTFITKVEHEALCARLDRLEAEIRSQLRDYADRFITNVEHEALCRQTSAIDKEVQGLRESRAELAGKADRSTVMWAYAISAVSLVAGIVLHFI